MYFDVCFGIIAPILWRIFDPAVFRSDGYSVGAVNDFRLYAYTEIAIASGRLLTFF